MKYIKIVIIAILLFATSYAVGSFFGINDYPKKEFNRVVDRFEKGAGGTWKLFHRRGIINSDYKEIVKPAVDFLYSSAILDAAEGPHVISIPPIDRYFTFQFMEDDTDVFDYIGSRTHGRNKALNILITPNGFEGETLGLETIEMKTDKVWVLARFQIFNKEDVPNVQSIQNAIRFIPLADWNQNLKN